MKWLEEYTEQEIKDAFRERTPKDTALLLKLSSKAKEIIEQAAREVDLDTSAFIRKSIEKEVERLAREK